MNVSTVKLISVGIILLIMFLVILYFMVDHSSSRSDSDVDCGNIDYSDMNNFYNSVPECIWMSNNKRSIHDAIYNTSYKVVVINSDGTIFYSNREGDYHHLMYTFEVISAVSLGYGTAVRHGCRNLARRACDNEGRYRVIHIS